MCVRTKPFLPHLYILRMSQEQVIKLEPMRLGDLVPKDTSCAVKKSGYVAPHLRSKDTSTAKEGPISLVESEFPTMGTSGPAPVVTPVVRKMPVINFKKAVDTGIEYERMNEEERARLPETDTLKMTEEQVIQAGWNIISVGRHYNAYQDDFVSNDDIPPWEYPSKGILQELEEEVDSYFKLILTPKSEDLRHSFRRKIPSREPLSEACMRRGKSKPV